MTKKEIIRLFNYTEWANREVLSASEPLADEELRRDFGSGQHSVLETLVHMLGAEWIWLERWKGKEFEQFATLAGPYKSDGATIATVRDAWNELEKERRRFIDTLYEQSMESLVTYKNFRGEEFSQPLIDQMQHVVNHATHHRGQVVGFLRALGVKPPTTDLIHYFRIIEK